MACSQKADLIISREVQCRLLLEDRAKDDNPSIKQVYLQRRAAGHNHPQPAHADTHIHTTLQHCHDAQLSSLGSVRVYMLRIDFL